MEAIRALMDAKANIEAVGVVVRRETCVWRMEAE